MVSTAESRQHPFFRLYFHFRTYCFAGMTFWCVGAKPCFRPDQSQHVGATLAVAHFCAFKIFRVFRVSIDRTPNIPFNRFSFRAFQSFRALRVSETGLSCQSCPSLLIKTRWITDQVGNDISRLEWFRCLSVWWIPSYIPNSSPFANRCSISIPLPHFLYYPY